MNEMDRFKVKRAIDTQQELFRQAEKVMADDAEKYAYAYLVLVKLERELEQP